MTTRTRTLSSWVCGWFLLSLFLCLVATVTSTVPERVHGKWTAWKDSGPCSVTCGHGTKPQSRYCILPKYVGEYCHGPKTRTVACFDYQCPVHGKWSPWKDSGPCSVTCGYGTKPQSRYCIPPRYGGKYCHGPKTQKVTCSITCPVHGKWSPWKDSGPCSVKCGYGTKPQSRYCIPPKHGGKYCHGPKTQRVSCNSKPCSVDGKWTPWKDSGPCSVKCGHGTKPQSRHCIPPKYGGKYCHGPKTRRVSCFNICAVDGKWSPWKDSGPCSVTCGYGTKPQSRYCIPPKHGGKYCHGPKTQRVSCNSKPCPVHGKWTPWIDSGPCSVKCGHGTKPQSRYCIPPKYGGKYCHGPTTRKVACWSKVCPVHGKWTAWKDSGPCSVKCGRGTKPQSRYCIPPKHGGKYCHGPKTQRVVCYAKSCPVNGGWTHWTKWSSCFGPCWKLRMTRTRSCTNPKPQHGGKTCVGPSVQTQPCWIVPKHCLHSPKVPYKDEE